MYSITVVTPSVPEVAHYADFYDNTYK